MPASLLRPPSAVIVLLLATGAPAAAQTTPLPSGPLTLEHVLELAEARSESIAAARAGVARAEGDRMRARSGVFPQLTASIAYDRALASEFEGVFENFASDDDRELDLPFGRENTWRLNLAFSQNLYSGGRLGAQQALARAGQTAADIELTTARAQLLFEATQAYYDAALSDRMVGIAEATLEQAEATVRQVNASFKAGSQPEFELLRARVARDNQTPALIRQRANRELSLIRLKQLLDLPPQYDLRLAVSLDDAALPPPAFAAHVAEVEQRSRQLTPVAALVDSPTPLPDRAPVQEAATVVHLREAALDAARAERMPSVAVNSSYGRVGYPSGAVPELDRTNWTVGVAMTVPLLTGGRLRGDRIVAQAELDQSRAQLQQVHELAAVDTRSAWAELAAARAAWEATGGTVAQAVRAHEIAQVRYGAGVSTQLELSDARLLLQQAEANRAQAARDLQVARARVALLPDLPLGTIGQPTPSLPTTPQPSLPAAPAAPSGGIPVRNANTPMQSAAFPGSTGGPR
jgi:outer membrane protein